MGRGFQTGKTTKGHSLTRAGGLCSKGAACLPGLCRCGVRWPTVRRVQPARSVSLGDGREGWSASAFTRRRSARSTPDGTWLLGCSWQLPDVQATVRGGRRGLSGMLRGALAFGRRPGRHSAGRVRQRECARAPRPGSGSACTSRFPAAIRPRPRRHWLGHTKGRSQGKGRQTWRQCMPCSAAPWRYAEVLQNALLGPLQGRLQALRPRGPWGLGWRCIRGLCPGGRSGHSGHGGRGGWHHGRGSRWFQHGGHAPGWPNICKVEFNEDSIQEF